MCLYYNATNAELKFVFQSPIKKDGVELECILHLRRLENTIVSNLAQFVSFPARLSPSLSGQTRQLNINVLNTLSICLSVSLSLYLSACLSVCLSIYLCGHINIYVCFLFICETYKQVSCSSLGKLIQKSQV